MTAKRRLAAILAADVAGYSRLMGADEEGTHERLKAHLQELVYPKIERHRGRIVKNTGDGFLADFQSVVDATRCAVEVQRSMADREPAVPEERRIRFRIGVNLGDVIVEEHDIFGDGVNVAARLEALAEPGGMCISRVVRDQIRDKLPYPFADLGEQRVKNIARPVRAYALRRQAIAELLLSSAPLATPVSRSARPPRLSIVVLPFANLSNDPDQGYFADGITEDLTTDLSRIADMLVISRNSAFTYKDKPVNAKQIGRELNVRYVLEGSIRRSGNRVRANAQLIDAETDVHLWAERFDRDTDDLFALQDEVTGRIAIALNIELVGAEAARSADHPDAMDFILQGRALSSTPPTTENYAEAIRLYERALTLDPQSVAAPALLARTLAARAMDGLTNSAEADITRAERLVWQALAASPRSPLAHYARGSIEEAIAAQEQAIRLSPRDPQLGIWYLRIGQAHLLHSRIDEATLWFEKARTANPRLPFARAFLASAYALKGERDRAAAELAEARRLSGGGRFLSIAHSKTVFDFGVPKVRALYEATYFAGLRKAGMPEE